jgi:hypothetical protein
MSRAAPKSAAHDIHAAMDADAAADAAAQDEKRSDAARGDMLWFCCRRGYTDARLLKYLCTMATMFSIVVFCFVRLSDRVCDDRELYVGLLTLCVGIMLPRPSMTRGRI